MPVAGVIVLTEKEKSKEVLLGLKNVSGVTTYGVHKDMYIVAVFESEMVCELEGISKEIIENIHGVIGVYPTYVNIEDIDDSA